MDQSEKNIENRMKTMAMIAEANIKMLEQNNFVQVYSNLTSKLRYQFEIGLLRWRRGESPIADLASTLATGDELLLAIDQWSIPSANVAGYGYVWDLARYASFLLGHRVSLPPELLELVRREQSRHADMALEYHVLDAIEGRERRENWEGSLHRLASKKRQALAVESYRTYFALLEGGSDRVETEALVRRAETNYVRRAKDAFYAGGPTYLGGGPDNPYVVDFTLAAILKKMGWEGESVHKWKWM